jgi:hypothetical protein
MERLMLERLGTYIILQSIIGGMRRVGQIASRLRVRPVGMGFGVNGWSGIGGVFTVLLQVYNLVLEPFSQRISNPAFLLCNVVKQRCNRSSDHLPPTTPGRSITELHARLSSLNKAQVHQNISLDLVTLVIVLGCHL